MMDLHDIAGLSGISLSLYCYGRAQWNPNFMKRVAYSALNIVSALLLAVSLMRDWNLAFFMSNTIWGLISLYGLVRSLKPVGRPHLHVSRHAAGRPSPQM